MRITFNKVNRNVNGFMCPIYTWQQQNKNIFFITDKCRREDLFRNFFKVVGYSGIVACFNQKVELKFSLHLFSINFPRICHSNFNLIGISLHQSTYYHYILWINSGFIRVNRRVFTASSQSFCIACKIKNF